MTKIPTLVLGGTGYVAGELMRLIAGHPGLELVGVMSESSAGTRIKDVFKQLHGAVGDQHFKDKQALLAQVSGGQMALFSAAPHGASAALVGEFIARAEQSNCSLTVVDVSADFRFSSNDAYAAVYGQPHGAPEQLAKFTSALPEHLGKAPTPHIGHPGCFASAL